MPLPNSPVSSSPGTKTDLNLVPTILVHGTTFGVPSANTDWWRPDQPFWTTATAKGLTLVDKDDIFEWSGALAGLWGQDREWLLWGKALRWYTKPWGLVNLIAHSHGGAVALVAASLGCQIHTLVTAATPVRKDMESIYAAARPNIRTWVHVFGEHDPIQIAGEVGDGVIRPLRTMALADLNFGIPTNDHHALHNPAIWTDNLWWQWLL